MTKAQQPISCTTKEIVLLMYLTMFSKGELQIMCWNSSPLEQPLCSCAFEEAHTFKVASRYSDVYLFIFIKLHHQTQATYHNVHISTEALDIHKMYVSAATETLTFVHASIIRAVGLD